MAGDAAGASTFALAPAWASSVLLRRLRAFGAPVLPACTVAFSELSPDDKYERNREIGSSAS